jgi:hypothetical protein
VYSTLTHAHTRKAEIAMADLKQRMKKWWLRTGEHSQAGRSMNLENRSLNLSESGQTIDGTAKEKIGESQTLGGVVPDIENTDPTKRRIRFPRKVGSLERWFRRQRVFWKPPLTPDEKDDLAQRRYERLTYSLRRSECKRLNVLIPNAYAGLGIEYVRTSKNKHEREKVERVTFSKWEWTVDGNTAWGKVCTIPYGHNATELVDSRVLSSLSFSVGKPVSGILNDKGAGVMISVEIGRAHV